MAANSTSVQPQRRRLRNWFILIGAALFLLCVLVVLVPTFISWGVANGYIRNQLQSNINGSVELDRVTVAWFGSQGVEGLHVKYPNGKTAARVDVSVHAGLLGLLFGTQQAIDVHVAGQANGHIRNGKVSFEELLVKDTRAPRPKPSTRPSGEPFRLPEIPPFTLHIRELDVDFVDYDRNQHYVIGDMTGELAYREPTEPISLELKSQTVIDDVPGSLTINALGDGLFNARGELSLRNGSAKVDVVARSIPLGATGQDALVNSLTMSLASDDLTERIALVINADGKLQGREPSTLALNASVNKVLTSRGEFSARGGGANVNLQAQNVPILGANVNGVVRSMQATLTSADLTRQLDIGIEGQTQLDQNPPSPLVVNLSFAEPFDADGTAQFARLDRMTGEARAESIPGAVVQPFLPEPLVASRDVGPTVNVQASFGAGERRDLNVIAFGEKARLELTANVDPAATSQAITGSHLLLASPSADPAVVKHYTSFDVDRSTDVEIRLTSFSLPAIDPQTQTRPKQHMAAAGTLRVNGPTAVLLVTGEESAAAPAFTSIDLADLQVQFDTPALGRHLRVEGSATIDGAQMTFNELITNLYNQQGEMTPANALAAGELRLTGLQPQTLAKFAPEQQHIIQQAIGDNLSTTVTSTVRDSQMLAQIEAQTAAAHVRAHAVKAPDTITLQSSHVELELTAKLLRALQQEREKPITVADPAMVTLEFDQIQLVKNSMGAFALADEPINATISVVEMVVENAPGFAEPVGVRELVAQLTRQREGTYESYMVNGDVSLHRPQNDRLLGHARYRVKINTKQDGDGAREILPHADVGFNEFSVRQLERMLAMERDAISQWTGDTGEISMHVEGDLNSRLQGHVRTELPNLNGLFRAETDMKAVSIAADSTSMTLSREAVENRLNPDEGGDVGDNDDGASPNGSRRITMAADVPMALDVRSLQFPMALATGETFDPAQVQVDVRLTGGPITLINPDQQQTSVRDLAIVLNTANLGEGLSFSIRGSAESTPPPSPAKEPSPERGDEPEGTIGRRIEEPQTKPASPSPASGDPGQIDVQGKLVGFLNEAGAFDLDAAKLQMAANVTSMPTAIADAFANMKGMLVAAVGPQMNAKFEADDFSVDSGTLHARIDATNGWLEAPLRGREHAFRTIRDQAIRAELAITPPLRERLLQNIHPILADIRTTEQPVRVRLPLAVLRFNQDTNAFDVSQMRADIEITIGAVELDSGSRTLNVLRFFGEAEQRATIPGNIEPITATIRNGVVKYQKFTVQIDKYTLNYSGEINLVTNGVNLRTEVPLQALGQAIRELEPYADKIVVPLVTRGTLGNLKTQIDPDFDIGKAALEAGFRGSLQQFLQGEDGGSLRELLEGLDRKKK